jgi:hypothetical protein
MTRRTPALVLAALALVGGASQPAEAAKEPPAPQLVAGARVGVVNLLDAEVTHFHASTHIENSYLKTYPLNWSVNAMLLSLVTEHVTQLGFTAVPLAPGDMLTRARESCFLNAALAKGLSKECAKTFAVFAAASQLSALIVLGPGRNDSNHAGGARHKELPEYLRGWCFVTGEGTSAAPQLLDLTELLLIATPPAGAMLLDREWGGGGGGWPGYQAPPDLKAIPQTQLDQLQPLFSAMLKRQADALLAHLQLAH